MFCTSAWYELRWWVHYWIARAWIRLWFYCFFNYNLNDPNGYKYNHVTCNLIFSRCWVARLLRL
jgi:hypothetical protein